MVRLSHKNLKLQVKQNENYTDETYFTFVFPLVFRAFIECAGTKFPVSNRPNAEVWPVRGRQCENIPGLAKQAGI